MKELIKYGQKMVEGGLVWSHSGNMSKRQGDKMLITATGSMMDELEGNIVELPIFELSSKDTIASKEVLVHREVYKKTPAQAIIHTHSPFAVIISLISEGEVTPEEIEGLYYLRHIPIVSGNPGSSELAERVTLALFEYRGAIIKGHGPIARGDTVDEAYMFICIIEHACKVKYFADISRQLGLLFNNISVMKKQK